MWTGVEKVGEESPPREARRGVLLLATLLALLAAGAARGGVADEIRYAEDLVRAAWYEGVPYESALLLTPAGVDRLIDLLEDSGEVEHHPNIVMALGMRGLPRAFPALRRLAQRAPHGEVSATEYRTRMALPLALGHLARSDPRALVPLRRTVRHGAAPDWSYRRLHGRRLARELERAAISGLALSGRPEALDDDAEARALGRAPKRRAARLRAHFAEARALCGRIADEGAGRVFGSQRSRR